MNGELRGIGVTSMFTEAKFGEHFVNNVEPSWTIEEKAELNKTVTRILDGCVDDPECPNVYDVIMCCFWACYAIGLEEGREQHCLLPEVQ